MASKRSLQLFKKLKKLRPEQRVREGVNPDYGRMMLSLLTPTQYAELFPKWYRAGLPDVGGFRAALTKKSLKEQEDRLGEIEKKVGSSSGAAPEGGSGKISNPVKAKEIYDYLRSKGVDHVHAVGMVNNIQHESAFNSANDTGDGGTSFGLFQHHLGRGARMKEVAGANGQDWRTNWKGQIDYALSEPETKRYLATEYSSGSAASMGFTTIFERPANAESTAVQRLSTIKTIERLSEGPSTMMPESTGAANVAPIPTVGDVPASPPPMQQVSQSSENAQLQGKVTVVSRKDEEKIRRTVRESPRDPQSPDRNNTATVNRREISRKENVNPSPNEGRQIDTTQDNINEFHKNVQSHAGGGKEKIEGKISINPMPDYRGDNAMVTDESGKQFTINTEKEKMIKSSGSNTVQIVPKDPGYEFIKGSNVEFSKQSPILMKRLMKDFNLSKEQAAGVVGNLAKESEVGGRPLTAGGQEEGKRKGKGGLGWGQWTGIRRKAFSSFAEQYGKANNIENPTSDPEVNYQFLKSEFEGVQRKGIKNFGDVIPAVKSAKTAREASEIFMHKYEKPRASTAHLKERIGYAEQAMTHYDADQQRIQTAAASIPQQTVPSSPMTPPSTFEPVRSVPQQAVENKGFVEQIKSAAQTGISKLSKSGLTGVASTSQAESIRPAVTPESMNISAQPAPTIGPSRGTEAQKTSQIPVATRTVPDQSIEKSGFVENFKRINGSSPSVRAETVNRTTPGSMNISAQKAPMIGPSRAAAESVGITQTPSVRAPIRVNTETITPGKTSQMDLLREEMKSGFDNISQPQLQTQQLQQVKPSRSIITEMPPDSQHQNMVSTLPAASKDPYGGVPSLERAANRAGFNQDRPWAAGNKH